MSVDFHFNVSFYRQFAFITRTAIAFAAYHEYSIALHFIATLQSPSPTKQQQQQAAITKRWRYSFFMSPHLATKRSAGKRKKIPSIRDQREAVEIERTAAHDRKPWAMTSEILFTYLLTHSTRIYCLLFFQHFSYIIVWHLLMENLAIIEYVGGFNSSQHLGINVKAIS